MTRTRCASSEVDPFAYRISTTEDTEERRIKSRKLLTGDPFFALCPLWWRVFLTVRDLDGIPDPPHRLLSYRTRTLRAFEQDVPQMIRLREHGGSPLADWIEMRVERVGQLGLHLHVADLAEAVTSLEIVDLGLVRVERVVIGEHRIAFDRSGRVGAHALRIGIHAHHLLLHIVCAIRQVDGVAEALAHLLVAVEPGQAGERREQRLRLDEHVAEEVVETPDHLARQLEVRHLILADRN